MKLEETLLGQSVRLFDDNPDVPRSGHLARTRRIKIIEERYGFHEAPRSIGQYDADSETGIVFKEGTYQDKFDINELRIQGRGILVRASAGTEQCDELLDEIFEWFLSELPGHWPMEQFPLLGRAYTSHVVVSCDYDLSSYFNAVSEIGTMVARAVNSYRNNSNEIANYQGSSFTFDPPLDRDGPPNPGAFVFARRANSEFSENKYFSSAPLRTEDHLGVLQSLERLLLA